MSDREETITGRGFLREALTQKRRLNALVIGDVMLDQFLYCTSNRCSPEEPSARVLMVEKKHSFLGGAANVAANTAALGVSTTLIGVIGRDDAGRDMLRLSEDAGINAYFYTDVSRPTTVKTRYLLSGAHYMRHDTESDASVEAHRLLDTLALASDTSPDIIYFSDYAKGVFSDTLVKALLAQYGDAVVIADAKPLNAAVFRGIDVLKVNVHEAHAITGIRVEDQDGANAAVTKLSALMEAAIILTRGREGMTLCDRLGESIHVPAHSVEVGDVTGAGDTTLSTLGFMLGHSAPIRVAAEAAAIVSAIAVSKKGTTAPSRDDILAVLT